MSGNVRYDTVTSQEWLTAVSRWGWAEWRNGDQLLGWRKVGECPRCHHQIALYQEIVYGILPVDAAVDVDVVCNCEYTHEGRPDSVSAGCGQHGRIPAHEGGS